MKQFFAHIILIVYCSSIAISIFPLIEYGVNYELITEVLCINKDKPEMNCQGSCHLTKQLQAVSSSEQQGDPLQVESEIVFFSFVIAKKSEVQFFLNEISFYYPKYATSSQEDFLEIPTPPPIV